MKLSCAVHRSMFVIVACLIGHLVVPGLSPVYAGTDHAPPTIMSYQG